eukprot:evm.model.scf_1113EXC.1 EVM.evm.TU.scf_1113EXC.1   scf_1113EXC:1500-6638(+)
MAAQSTGQLEYLGQVLRKFGPGAVPYAESVRSTILEHIRELLKDFPNLNIKDHDYTHNDGRVVRLLKAEGTLPMYYQKVKYNIPVAVWLPDNYPHQAPIVYVTPTPDMIIKPGHTHVDPSGLVMTPYFQHWSPPRSNLVDMAYDMSITFGQEPPLFSKPPGWTPPPQSMSRLPGQGMQHPPGTFQAANPVGPRGPPAGYPYPGTTGPPPASNPFQAAKDSMTDPYNVGTSGQAVNPSQNPIWGAAAAAAAANAAGGAAVARPPGYPAPQKHSTTRPEDVTRAFREAAIKALSMRLSANFEAHDRQVSEEADELLEEQNQLTMRAQELQKGISAMQQERAAYEQCVKDMSLKTQELSLWLQKANGKADAGPIDPDTVIVPEDELCRQALESQAEDLAIEDCLYALDKALQNEVIGLDSYLKQVRQLCNKQFFARVLGAKVASRQSQHPIPARHGSGPGVPMPQGDSWAASGILMNPLAGQRA